MIPRRSLLSRPARTVAIPAIRYSGDLVAFVFADPAGYRVRLETLPTSRDDLRLVVAHERVSPTDDTLEDPISAAVETAIVGLYAPGTWCGSAVPDVAAELGDRARPLAARIAGRWHVSRTIAGRWGGAR